MEGKVHRAFIRVGLKNQGVQYNSFLLGLEEYTRIPDTKYLYPVKKKGKKRKR
jgi:hypothetical protein